MKATPEFSGQGFEFVRSLLSRASATGSRNAGKSRGPDSGETDSSASAPPSRRSVEDALFYCFLAMLAWAPFWFASNRPAIWGVNAIGIAALTLAYEATLLWSGKRHPVSIGRIWPAALIFAAVCLWSWLQMAPSIPRAYQHPVWQMARDLLKRDFPGSISVSREDTVLALLRFATYGLTFWLALQMCRSAERAWRLVQAVAIIGAVYAAYGIVAFYIFPKTILWFEKEGYTDSLTSTFVNRNSYATYAGIGLVCCFSLISTVYLRETQNRAASLGRRIAGFVAITAGDGGLWISCAFVIGAALVLTGSRGGVAATVGGILACLSLVAVRGRKNATAVGFTLLLSTLAIGAAFLNYGDFLADRLTTEGLASDDRLAAYGLTWRSISDAPLLGFGDGTFQDVFPMYRDRSVGILGVWDKCHNSYLEALQGLGVPLALALFGALLYLFGKCVRAALTRKAAATAPLAASAATTILALHAFVDFSIQIQAIALTWAALIGAGVAQSWSSRERTSL
ncbi:O-antigen ligase family protein [Methylocystis heyeri]|uniref:O-antigen ligase-related domain-containing protein n=1 Tax=Methylocystis heyeri TaxID=391905 RepID=A0A6B8K9Z2_9HYPH|nr:O-antigen ligase family protein [Methylocystis heyeri]QGM44242.1 hypothetical protein H2LOC_000150 [Methylocystis heyeri]